MREATRVGDVVTARTGMRYRHFDDPTEALGDRVESDLVPFANYREDSFYVLEFEAPIYPDVESTLGPVLADRVVRVFDELDNGSGERSLDLRLLRWLFPNAEFVSVEQQQNPDPDGDAQYVVVSVGLSDRMTPLSLTEYQRILSAPVSVQTYDFLPFLRLRFDKELRADLAGASLEYRRHRCDEDDELLLVLTCRTEQRQAQETSYPLNIYQRKPFYELIIDCSRSCGVTWITGHEVEGLFTPEARERFDRGE